eukprot:TRINITY_DN3819_c0_g1_i2.p1 TRINITY_DN3819_c0_g1~~TRINITY_DN3819_c0_g1_i2.p1  ORF type:complete len:170 (-),score=24.17 TRINITY_DN3819_c0_g1_i2:88-597(-)
MLLTRILLYADWPSLDTKLILLLSGTEVRNTCLLYKPHARKSLSYPTWVNSSCPSNLPETRIKKMIQEATTEELKTAIQSWAILELWKKNVSPLYIPSATAESNNRFEPFFCKAGPESFCQQIRRFYRDEEFDFEDDGEEEEEGERERERESPRVRVSLMVSLMSLSVS